MPPSYHHDGLTPCPRELPRQGASDEGDAVGLRDDAGGEFWSLQRAYSPREGGLGGRRDMVIYEVSIHLIDDDGWSWYHETLRAHFQQIEGGICTLTPI